MTEATKYLGHCRKRYGPDDPRTRAAFAARVAEVEAAEKKTPMPGVWYLSFADEDKFLGGVFIHAETMTEALRKSHGMGINPGGSVLSFPPTTATAMIPEKYRNRLLSRQELDEIDPTMVLARN